MALSAARSPEFNVIVCSGDDPGIIARSLLDVEEVGAPTVIMLAGEALGWSQAFPDAGWVCVGAAPFMHLALTGSQTGVTDPGVRRLGARELDAARSLLVAANPGPPAVAEVALPDLLVESATMSLWGLDADGSLVAILTLSKVGDASAVWSMATDPGHRRRGYGRRLLAVVLAEAALSGSTHALLSASPSGAFLYRAMGFSVVEHWQQWSRPRWILGRT